MLELTIFVLVMMAAGYLLRRFTLASAEAAKDLTNLVFYLTLPALTFQALRKATLSWSMTTMPAIAWGYSFVAVALALIACWALRLSGPRAGAFIVAAVFGNTTFFGYPIVQGYYGESRLTLAIFYDLLGATMATNTLGLVVASHFGGRAVTPVSIARRLLLFPAMWALALGLAFNGVGIPPLLEHLLDRIGALTAPLIMLSLGMSLQFRRWSEDVGLVALAAASRLILLPLLVWIAVRALGLPLAYQQAAVLQAAMPTMFFSLTIALLFHLRVTLVVNAIMVSTLLSFLTLPAWHWLLTP